MGSVPIVHVRPYGQIDGAHPGAGGPLARTKTDAGGLVVENEHQMNLRAQA